MSGITPTNPTTKSFSITYYDGNTGIPFETVKVINTSGDEIDPEEKAVIYAHSHLLLHSSTLWDINEIEEEEPIAGKKRNVKGFWNTGNLATPQKNETA